jgi:hypothetical protein
MGLGKTFKKCVGLDPNWDPKQRAKQDLSNTDPFLRELVALALNFWVGTDAENREMDGLLVVLIHDQGADVGRLARLSVDNSDAFRPATVTGREIAYNAAIALANRGSDRLNDYLGMLHEMLTEDELKSSLKVRDKDGTVRTDAAAVAQTLMSTMKAIGELHRKKPDLDLSTLRPSIDALADHSNKAVKAEAKTLQALLDAK